MNDIKNFFIAYFSTASSVFAAIEAPTVITIVSAIILPILFFAVGKTVDVVVQIYLDRNRESGSQPFLNADKANTANEPDQNNQNGIIRVDPPDPRSKN
jgi:hypothetical protein